MSEETIWQMLSAYRRNNLQEVKDIAGYILEELGDKDYKKYLDS